MPRTVLRRLTLTDFRSYARVELALDGRPVFLFGPNGAGKTNLLEAISLLIPGRGVARCGPGRDRAARAERGAGPGLGGRGRGRGRRTGSSASAPALETADAARRSVRLDGESVAGRPARRRGAPRLADAARGSALPGGRRPSGAASSTGWSSPASPATPPRSAAYERALRERMRLLAEPPADPRLALRARGQAGQGRARPSPSPARRPCAR